MKMMRPKTLVVSVAALNLIAGLSFGFAFGHSTAHASGLVGATPCEVVRDAVHDPDFVHVADALELEPKKAERVRAILASCGPRFDTVMAEVRPRLLALHEQLVGELSAVLTKDEMDKLTGEYQRRYGASPHPR
jgi:hypothetical protein